MSLWIALSNYFFDSFDDFLSILLILLSSENELSEVQNLIVQKYERVFDLERKVTQPRVLISVILATNSVFEFIFSLSFF